jgi:hypothetical protein
MRWFVLIAFFLVACAGGQTHDPGSDKNAGGNTTVTTKGGSGGNTSGSAGSDKTAPSGGGGTNAAKTATSGGGGGASGSTATGSTANTEKMCGNGEIDSNERCDGNNLGGESCGTLMTGWTGQLLCVNCDFDTSMCFVGDTGNDEDGY